jgi:mannose-6-phosphate isomerase-like protein (cupin superfamily)
MRIVRKEAISEPFRSDTGEEIYEMIGHPAELGGTSKHSVAHVVIAPGTSSPAHYHREAEETYYILEGRGRLVIDGTEHQVTPGDACLIMPREVHQIFAVGEQPLELLAVCGPAWVPSDSYKPE